MAKVTMPQLGESVAEGTIGKWLKNVGDNVAKYEPLVEVITDKVNAEVPSPFEGILREILVEEGATVPNDAEIAIIETADEAGAASAAAPSAAGPTAAPAPAPTAAPAPAPTAAPAPGPAATEKEAPSSEPDNQPAHGPAGSDEGPADDRPDRAAPAAGAGAPSASAPTAGIAAGGAPAMSAPSAPTATDTTTRNGDARVGDAGAGNGAGNPDARMTPAVRRLLREHGLSPTQIVGTGGGGRITREDVTNFVESQRTGQPVNGQSAAQGATPAPAATPAATGAAPAATPAAPAPGAGHAAAAPVPARAAGAGAAKGTTIEFPDGADEVLVPLSLMRKGIAAQMTRALAAPHAYVEMELDATMLVALRESSKRDYQANEGMSLSYVPFVVKAVAESLKRHPSFNAHWTDQGLVAKRRINVGVAVAVDDGLLVPVIRDVDQLSINGLNRAIAEVAARARAGKLRLDDFGGGTFTVDNTGWLGSNLTMPILNVPEVAILTMEAITKRPVVIAMPDGDAIAIRPVMNMVLGIDHRANDGAGGAALLRDIKAWLEAVGPETPIF